MTKNPSNKTLIRVAVIGNEAVGKTSLCKALAGKDLDNCHIPTIGIDLHVAYINTARGQIKIALWDLSGQGKFDIILTCYVETYPSLIFCYSADSSKNFSVMVNKYDYYKNLGYLNNKHVIICATKIDSPETNNELIEKGKIFSQKYNHSFIKTSAHNKTGLSDLLQLIKEPYVFRNTQPNTIIVSPPPPKRFYHNFCNIL